jgi:anti-sigma factor RsiW
MMDEVTESELEVDPELADELAAWEATRDEAIELIERSLTVTFIDCALLNCDPHSISAHVQTPPAVP